MSLQVRPLSRSLGAEILDINISDSLDKDTRESIWQALLKYRLLLFREQTPEPFELVAFAKYFGEPDSHDSVPDYRYPGINELMLVTNKLRGAEPSPSRNIGRQWHSDHSMTLHPTLATFLHAKELPSVGGDTLFANTVEAFETLSEPFKEFLSKLWAVHDVAKAGHLQSRSVAEREAKRKLNPPVVHKIVRENSETGDSALYVSEMMTSHILGVRPDESDVILKFLFNHSTNPLITYRHKWQVGDLVVWDNRTTLHNALADFDQNEIRLMWRASIKGPPDGYVLTE